MKKYLYTTLIVLFAAIFLVSGAFLLDYFIKSRQQKSQYDELANIVQQGQQNQQQVQKPADDNNTSDNQQEVVPAGPTYVEVTHPVTGKKMEILSEYAPIFEKNSDTVGWIRIVGTKVDYPVMQTPEWVNFYLTRNFYKEESKHGAIYANEIARLNTPSDNVTLYGHSMADGSMFASLHNYKSKKFYEEHSIINFDTLTEHHTYEIFSVFVTTATLGEGFTYHTFVNGNEKDFKEFVDQCKALSLYDTGVEVLPDDKLVTLSTCDHEIENGRLVVVAKRIS